MSRLRTWRFGDAKRAWFWEGLKEGGVALFSPLLVHPYPRLGTKLRELWQNNEFEFVTQGSKLPNADNSHSPPNVGHAYSLRSSWPYCPRARISGKIIHWVHGDG